MGPNEQLTLYFTPASDVGSLNIQGHTLSPPSLPPGPALAHHPSGTQPLRDSVCCGSQMSGLRVGVEASPPLQGLRQLQKTLYFSSQEPRRKSRAPFQQQRTGRPRLCYAND